MLQDKHKKPKGSALITALFIMALIAAAATAMIYELQLSISSAEQVFNYSQALQYNDTVTDWAINKLKIDIRYQTNPPTDKLPSLYPTTIVNGGQYRGALYDMQNKFNLNNLADPKQRDGFTNLLKTILPSSQNPVLLAAAISNWVSPSGQFPLADDLAYKKAGLPAAPHRFMLNISELRNVAGINAALYQLLLHYVTVLPRKDTPLNINTAITADLITTGKNISLTTAKAIANARPYLSDTDIAANPTIKIHPEMASQLTTTSEFFVARSLVQLGDQQLLNNSFINRNKSTGKTRVLWQTQGGN